MTRYNTGAERQAARSLSALTTCKSLPMATSKNGPVRTIQATAAAAAVAPIVATGPVYDPGRAERLKAFCWEPETSSTVKSGAPTVSPLVWSEGVTAAAADVGFILPDASPRTRERKMPDGSKRHLPWRLVGMPEDPARLLLPVFSGVAVADRTTVKLLDGILKGLGGCISSLASGEPLPLLDLLCLFANPTIKPEYDKNKSWHQLVNSRQANMTILNAMAQRLGRYVYVADEVVRATDKAD